MDAPSAEPTEPGHARTRGPRASGHRFAAHVAGICSSAGLGFLAEPPGSLGFLGPVALVPWLLVLRHRPPLSAATSGLALGTLNGLLGILWLPAGLERMGAGPGNAVFGALGLAVWGGGLPWACFGFLAGCIRRSGLPARVFLLGAVLCGIDLLRSYAPGGLPLILLGHTQWAVHGVAQLALLGGVPLISGFLMATNVAIAGAIVPGPGRRTGFSIAFAMLSAYALLAATGVPVARALRPSGSFGENPVELLVVQPSLHPRERWSPLVQQTNLAIIAGQTQRALKALSRPPAAVIWPENTLTTPVDTDPDLASRLQAAVDSWGIALILGTVQSVPREPAQIRSSALWLAPGRGTIQSVDKGRAIPVIESSADFPGRVLLEAAIGLEPDRYRVAEAVERSPLEGFVEFGVLLCFEALFPADAAAVRTPRTAALLNLGNDSWFLSDVPSAQQLAFISFRAIEQRSWLVRAVHGGASAVYDPYGRIVSKLAFGERGHLLASIHEEPEPSAYERVALAALLIAGGSLGFATSGFLLRAFDSRGRQRTRR